MQKSIAEYLFDFNKNFSQSTVVRSVTTRKSNKLHSSDIPMLKVMAYFHRKGVGKTYLKRSQWPVMLEKFGGKPITYRPFKAKTAKLRSLGLINCYREGRNGRAGNRNKEYTWVITKAGLEALDNFTKNYPPQKKNSPSEIKKQPLENKKTAPPLNHVQSSNNHVPMVVLQLAEKDPEILVAYEALTKMGFYPVTAKKILTTYTLEEVFKVWKITKSANIINRGAYMTSLLRKFYGNRSSKNE